MASATTRPTTVKQHITPPVVNKQKQLLSGIVKRKRYIQNILIFFHGKTIVLVHRMNH
jgi:hypothetical protein